VERKALPGVALALDMSLTNGQLALVTLGRLALTTAYRILYPLQPFLVLHLNVDLRTVTLLVTTQVFASLISPLGGALTDTRGERTIMAWALGLFCVGSALCALSATFGVFLVGYALIGLAIALYQPAAQAYLSARTQYARRGRALGVLELSWAGAALLGVAPLMQVVQATRDLSLVFWLLLIAGGISLALIRFALPPTPWHADTSTRRIDWSALRAPRVVAMLAMLMLCMGAIDLIFVIQAVWLKASFGTDEGQLGLVFGMLGIAELIGTISSASLVDRLGKKRSVIGGFALTALCMAALPLSEGRWLLFLVLFFLFDLCFEFSLVSVFPLISGIAPHVRGTILALSVAAVGVGRTVGSQLSAPLWSHYGITANALVGAGMLLAGVALCVLFVHETEAAGNGVTG
jgi:MFS transporter, DHA1 family, inner membrane transport protein